MTHIDLNDGLKTCHSAIDSDHQVLVDLINQLHEALKAGSEDDICSGIVNDLINYAVRHFSMEESLMVKHRYSNTVKHVTQHKQFLITTLDYKTEADAHWKNVGTLLHEFLRNWLIEHILHYDREMVAEIFKLPHPDPNSLEMKIAGHIIRDKLAHS